MSLDVIATHRPAASHSMLWSYIYSGIAYLNLCHWISIRVPHCDRGKAYAGLNPECTLRELLHHLISPALCVLPAVWEFELNQEL